MQESDYNNEENMDNDDIVVWNSQTTPSEPIIETESFESKLRNKTCTLEEVLDYQGIINELKMQNSDFLN